MRHIDADELLNRLPDNLPYKSSVKRVLMQAPEADVVPKSQVDLYKKLNDELEDELASTYDKLENAETEVARDIFEEIENALIENFHADCQMGDCIEDYYDENLRDDIFKIRKKYLEEKE